MSSRPSKLIGKLGPIAFVAVLAVGPAVSAGANGARPGAVLHPHTGFTSLALKNGWKSSPFGTGKAQAANIQGVVTFKGAISAGTSAIAFTLPLGLRPSKATFVRVDTCNATSGRLYIQASGVVSVEAGTTFADAVCFTSLDGASFALSAPVSLALKNGWKNGPFSTDKVAAIDIQGIVHFKGAMTTTGTNTVAFTLPKTLRPSKAVYVAIGLCNASQGRLIIAPTGVVKVEARGTWSEAQCFTSLDGASYALTATTTLPLRNGWKNGPFLTSSAAATKILGVVHLKGAISTAKTNPVPFTLPVSLRPAKAVYVTIGLCNSAGGRLSIQPSGLVTVEAENTFSEAQCFTSLDGVSFAP